MCVYCVGECIYVCVYVYLYGVCGMCMGYMYVVCMWYMLTSVVACTCTYDVGTCVWACLCRGQSCLPCISTFIFSFSHWTSSSWIWVGWLRYMSFGGSLLPLPKEIVWWHPMPHLNICKGARDSDVGAQAFWADPWLNGPSPQLSAQLLNGSFNITLNCGL